MVLSINISYTNAVVLLINVKQRFKNRKYNADLA